MTSTALVPFEPDTLSQALALADRLALANLVPVALRKQPADVLLIIMHGRDLGLSPSQALRGLHIVEGKVVMSADLMAAMVLRHPEICERFALVESTDTRATYEAKRVGQESVRLSWTIDQARAAKLTGKSNWAAYPAAMLRARCCAAIARAVFPDLLFGVYETSELADAPAAPPPIRATPVAAEPNGYDALDRGDVAHEDNAGVVGAVVAHISQAAEVAPPVPEGQPAKRQRTVDELRAAIEAATEDGHLEALIDDLRSLVPADQNLLRPLYQEKSMAFARVSQ
jgi:hypothetical protein